MGDHAAHGRQALTEEGTEGGEDADAARAARARRLFAQPCVFVAGAASIEQLPPATLPEVAFAGRSNVGKSSLINAVTNRKSLANTSRTPGRTRQVNFFLLADSLFLVDLPGYGYARAAKSAIRNWTDLIDAYLAGRPVLRRTMLLIDARHGVKETDRRVMELLERAAVPFQAVLTKADAAGEGALAAVRAATAAELAKWTPAHPQVLATSAKGGRGIAELRCALAALSDWSADPAPAADAGAGAAK